MNEKLFCRGYTWGAFAREGDFQRPEAETSMRRLASNGLNWICIPVNAWQETYHSLTVFSLYGRTQSDDDLRTAILLAHQLGLKVCLKPMVNCLDGVWRARIDFPSDHNHAYWNQWFQSYQRFLNHYAVLAEKTGCEMFCTGCEMVGMDKQADHCLQMIDQVRQHYHGIIMHNINHGDEMLFSWLHAIDVIGISAYYPVTDEQQCGIDSMRKKWKYAIVPRLEKCHAFYRKPLMFAEIGVRNEQGCTKYPWDYQNRPDLPCDEQEQADFYESAMEATWGLPWFSGYFWWDWRAILPTEESMHENRGFTVYGKLAESTLKKWYTK